MQTSSPDAAGWPRSAVGPVRLADALGWGSAALGAPMTFAPRRFLRAIGIKDDDEAVRWTLFVGAREYLATINIVAARHRRVGMWSRVLGDTMDLTLLARAYQSKRKRKDAEKLQRAMAAVGGIMLLDLVTATLLTRAEGGFVDDGSTSTGTGVEHDTGGGPLRVRTAVTIRRPEDEVREAFRTFAWSAFDPAALEGSGDVRFMKAPGERGTELHLDHEPEVRGGAIGAAAAKVAGKAPDQLIHDELRRFKALIETGVVPASETTPEGASSTRQILQKGRPAQPVGKEG